MCVCVCVCLSVCLCVCVMHIYAYMHVYIQIYICLCVCVCVCVCVCTSTSTFPSPTLSFTNHPYSYVYFYYPRRRPRARFCGVECATSAPPHRESFRFHYKIMRIHLVWSGLWNGRTITDPNAKQAPTSTILWRGVAEPAPAPLEDFSVTTNLTPPTCTMPLDFFSTINYCTCCAGALRHDFVAWNAPGGLTRTCPFATNGTPNTSTTPLESVNH